MDPSRIADLLRPFLGNDHASDAQLNDISIYIDLLLRWNARINLTAIRDPEEMVTRHFGESLFAARCLFPEAAQPTESRSAATAQRCENAAQGASPGSEADHIAAPQGRKNPTVIDLGSGAGFPGLPIKIWAPDIHLTLIECNQRKATFLRETTRALTLTDVNVFSGRAEDFQEGQGSVVILRAVERFESALLGAARLLAPAGRLALLIGSAQVPRPPQILRAFTWQDSIPVPHSSNRVLLLGELVSPA